MILSHMAPSSFNMTPYRAIWTDFRPHSMILKDKESRNSHRLFLTNMSLSIEKAFFPKVVRLKNDAEAYRRITPGPNLQQHNVISVQFKDL